MHVTCFKERAPRTSQRDFYTVINDILQYKVDFFKLLKFCNSNFCVWRGFSRILNMFEVYVYGLFSPEISWFVSFASVLERFLPR